MMSPMRAAIAIALLALIACAAAPLPALAAVPAELASEFERISVSYGDFAEAEATGIAADDELAAMTRRAALQGAESRLAAAAIGAIAERRGETGDIVEAAVRAMPQLEAGLVARILAAFPGFRDAVLAGAARAARPPEPQPVAAAEPAEPVEPAEPQVEENFAASPPSEESFADPPQVAAAGSGPEVIDDPLEGFNRAVFFVNDALDTLILRPAAFLYGNLTPPVVKQRVTNFFGNLGEPVVFANDMLQGEFEDAATTAARFAVNTTLGLAGLFDVATDFGLPAHDSDFGETLHAWGVGPGPYLMLPLFGPSTLRDGTGVAVDTLMNPFGWLLEDDVKIGLAVGKGVVRREELLTALDALRDSSVDYYAALRSLYYQNRAVELGLGGAPGNEALDAEFDDFE
jgi:phospholipid-binding lipoprotein MlaA